MNCFVISLMALALVVCSIKGIPLENELENKKNNRIPLEDELKNQKNNINKRSKYEIWRGFGSDGYLYDFVRKRNRYEPKIEVPRVSYLSSQPVMHRFQRSRYDIWRAFGSDGYLYDFVK